MKRYGLLTFELLSTTVISTFEVYENTQISQTNVQSYIARNRGISIFEVYGENQISQTNVQSYCWEYNGRDDGLLSFELLGIQAFLILRFMGKIKYTLDWL